MPRSGAILATTWKPKGRHVLGGLRVMSVTGDEPSM